jgi:hypothetical protein
MKTAEQIQTENLNAAIEHIRLEQTCTGAGETLRAVIESFNALSPAERACLSEAAWIVKKERLNAERNRA